MRVPKAYPVYDEHYKDNVDVLREWLAGNAPNVFPAGRNGMHKYNNQDHSMLTAMLSVENILGAHHDVWTVNVEDEYHEEGDDEADRGDRARARGDRTPRRRSLPPPLSRRPSAPARARTDPVADAPPRDEDISSTTIGPRHLRVAAHPVGEA